MPIADPKHPNMQNITINISLFGRLDEDLFSWIRLFFLLREILGYRLSSFSSNPLKRLENRISDPKLIPDFKLSPSLFRPCKS
jgi:hypothetical protein